MFIRVKAVHYDFYKRRIGELEQQFPDLFNKRFPWPLAIGIHHQLAARTQFSPEEIGVILRIWTHRVEYYCMAQSVGSRMDLDGTLTLMHPEHAKMYVSVHQHIRDETIKRFNKSFHKVYGRPAFLSVPISQRKEIDFGKTRSGSSEGSSTSSGTGNGESAS